MIFLSTFCLLLPTANLQANAQYPPPPPEVPRGVVPEFISRTAQVIEVSEDKSASVESDLVRSVEAKALSPQRTKELEALLPAMRKTESNSPKFTPISYTRQPPPITKVIDDPFPSKSMSAAGGKPPRIATIPLKVLRVSKRGPVSSAESLTIVFNQPMVPVTSIEKMTSAAPVKLTPQPAGTWNWLSADAIEFRSKAEHFPKATTFRIKVPAQVSALSGSKLVSSYASTFETPAPFVNSINTPLAGRNQLKSLTPVMVLCFNQVIDSAENLKYVRLIANNKDCALRLATAGEIQADETTNWLSDGDKASRLIFCPNQSLPKDTEIKVTVKPGVISKEGPNRGRGQSFDAFRTYGAFAIDQQNKSVHDMYLAPNGHNQISFSNRLDEAYFKESMITVAPPVKEFRVQLNLDHVDFDGDFKLGVTYSISFSDKLRDIYGQYLSGPRLTRYRVRPLPPQLHNPGQSFGQIVPSNKPAYHVLTWNEPSVKVSILEARSSDWKKFERLVKGLSEQKAATNQLFSDFRLISTRSYDSSARIEEWNDTSVDLLPALKDASNHLIVVVEAPEKSKVDRSGFAQSRFAQWIEYSSIRMNVFNDSQKLLTMVTDIQTGEPVSGAEITLLPGGAKHTTGKDGLVRFVLDNDKQSVLECNVQNKTTVLPHQNGEWDYKPQASEFISYANTDRNLYRPGELVRVNGFLRWLDWQKNGALTVPAPMTEISYQIIASDQSEIGKGNVKTDKNGAFAFDFAIPKIIELGACEIHFTAVAAGKMRQSSDRWTSSTSFSVQEFRRPEFELALNSSNSEMILGDTATLTAKGNYRTGSALKHAKVHWDVQSNRANFQIPAFNEFQFQDYFPDWQALNNDAHSTLDGTSDSIGVDALKLKCKTLARVQPVRLNVSATVQDVNRQAWTQSTSILVHPAAVYIGVKAQHAQLTSNTPEKFDYVVCSPDGKMQSGYEVQLTVSTTKPGENAQSIDTIIKQVNETSTSAIKSCSFNFDKPGNYWFTLSVKDHEGRINRTRLAVHAERHNQSTKADAEAEAVAVSAMQQVIEISADKDKFAPGEIAEISLKTKFKSGHGLLLASTGLILDAIPFEFQDQSATISLPIRDTFYPNVQIHVQAVGADGATGTGDSQLKVPTDPVALNVSVQAQSESYQPGQKASLAVKLTDAKGNAVSDGQVAIAVVDESILALTNYSWANPLLSFYTQRSYLGGGEIDPNLISIGDLKPQYLSTGINMQALNGFGRARPESAMPPPPMPASYSDGEYEKNPGLAAFRVGPFYFQQYSDSSSGSAQTVKLRSDLSALAFYNSVVLTSSDGTAKVDFVLPGNLTRYRVMAVATKGAGQFGSSASTFTASLPLMVRPSAPRFLNFKDQCELPFVVENTSAKPVNAELVVRATNLIDPTTAKQITPSSAESGLSSLETSSSKPEIYLAGRSFEIGPNDRVEVRLPVSACQASESIVQAAAFADTASDAAEISIPFQPPVTAESFATYGQIDSGGVAQRIIVPSDVFKNIGGLEITTSSTAMQQLFDAGRYLESYPFTCSEQLSSQILGLGALQDLAWKFQTAVDLKSTDTTSLLNNDVIELCKRQQSDGGFGLWTKNENVKYPFVSIQCARALQESANRGVAVPEHTLESSKEYLKKIDNHISNDYDPSSQRALKAYALNVRMQMKDPDPKQARKLIDAAVDAYIKSNRISANPRKSQTNNADLQESLPRTFSLESLAWLLPVLAADKEHNALHVEAIQNILNQHISETGSTASMRESPYGGNSYLMYYSDSRLNAAVLEALIASQPSSDLIPKMVRGLLLQRHNGRWSTTQENAYSLLSLSKYFSVYEKVEPDFLAQFWLGEAVSFEQKFAGRSVTSESIKIPMEYLQAHMKDDLLTVFKKGAGRLYYRVGLNYAPENLKLSAANRGFKVTRTYTPVDAKSDLSRDSSGILHVKAGATLQVTVTVEAPGLRYHVAVTDPLPAGFESLNPETVGTRSVAEDAYAAGLGHWHSTWYEHQNFRDNQTEVFTTLMYTGEHDYSYFVHATTPGTFIVPPCKVEEMYAPETFGRTACETVVVN